MGKYSLLLLVFIFSVACQSGNKKTATDSSHPAQTQKVNNQPLVDKPILATYLAKAKQKSKYQDVKAIDLGNMDPCAFKGFRAVNQEEFKGLQLKQYLQKTMPDEAKFKKDTHFYYAFQQNVKGNVMVVLLSCIEGMSNEIVGLLYTPEGKLLSNTSLAYNGGDMDMFWNFKGQFKTNGVYAYGYKKYLGNKEQICEWYHSQFTFASDGKVSFDDTVFKAKADPEVPCYEKFRKKD